MPQVLSGKRILQEIDLLRNSAEEGLKQYQDSMKRISELTTMAFGDYTPEKTQSVSNVSETEVLKPISTPITNLDTKPPKTQTREGGRLSLKEVVHEALCKTNDAVRKLISNYPKNAMGLNITELMHIVKVEQKWTSKSENILPQIQQALYALRKEGKIERNKETKRYEVL